MELKVFNGRECKPKYIYKFKFVCLSLPVIVITIFSPSLLTRVFIVFYELRALSLALARSLVVSSTIKRQMGRLFSSATDIVVYGHHHELNRKEDAILMDIFSPFNFYSFEEEKKTNHKLLCTWCQLKRPQGISGSLACAEREFMAHSLNIIRIYGVSFFDG